MILRAGPAVIGFSVDDINSMKTVLIKNALFLIGRHSGWTENQLNAFKSRVKAAVCNMSHKSGKIES